MNGPVEWFAALGTIVAAALIAGDLGRRVTGWGFVPFTAVATTWVFAALTAHPPARPVAAMNAILLLINVWGAWQYLLNPRNKREIAMVEQCATDAREEIEAEDG